MHTNFLYGNVNERDHLENLVIDGRILVEWIINGKDGRA
jgi:hypothetical protein